MSPAGEGSRGGTGGDPPVELVRFVARFDRREYWLAHEELEELWQRDRRDFYKGMIQIAAAFLHIERHNWRGAERLLRTALEYIDGAATREAGFDVEAVRERAGATLDEVRRLVDREVESFAPRLFFTLAPRFAGDVPADAVGEERLPYRVRRYEEGYRPVRRDDT